MNCPLKLGTMEKLSRSFLSGIKIDEQSIKEFAPIFYESEKDFVPFEELCLCRSFPNDIDFANLWIKKNYENRVPKVPYGFSRTVRWMPNYTFRRYGNSLTATMEYTSRYETFWSPALVANSYTVRKLLIWIPSKKEWAHFTIEPKNEESFDMDLAFCQFLRAWFPWD